MKTKSLFLTVLFAFACGATSLSPAQTPAAPPAAGSPLITRIFNIPPDALTPGGPFDADPNNPGLDPAQALLGRVYAVSFLIEGSFASLDRASGKLTVRNTAAQLDLLEKLPVRTPPGEAEVESDRVPEGILQFEVISLPALEARKALIANPVEADLYNWLDGELEKKDSGVTLEHTHALRVRSGQRSKVEGINEFAYPTEFDPAQIPQTISLAITADVPPKDAGNGRVFPPWPYTAITPNSFTFRNLGWTVEAELTFPDDRKSADLNLAPQLVQVVAQIPVGLTGEVTNPVFETQKSSTQVHTWVGQPALVSTLSPPTNTGVPGGNKVDRVWLLFVTVMRPQ